jgi:formate hydrogenlyase subunit 6/NADH:ubiquinone oxidoreductase subunit I
VRLPILLPYQIPLRIPHSGHESSILSGYDLADEERFDVPLDQARLEITMIQISKESCTACGLCAKVCHEHCIEWVQSRSKTVPEIDRFFCSSCAQCIAICPRQALSWKGCTPVRFERGKLPTADQLEELLKERRTIRRFKPKSIDQARLTKIAEIGKCAPTNNYDLRLILIDDPDIMRQMDEIIMREVRLLHGIFFRFDVLFNLFSTLTPKIEPKVRAKLKHSVHAGTSMPTLPSVMVLVVGDRRVVLSEISAHYAIYTMILYAQSLGIGSRINASGSLNLDRSRAIRSRLNLAPHENILAMVEMGYPAVRFSNKVEGRTLPIQWNGGVSE